MPGKKPGNSKAISNFRDFLFLRDRFGIFPMWSLQHPLKGYRESYLVPTGLVNHPEPPVWLKALKDYATDQDRRYALAHDPEAFPEVVMSGTVTWHRDGAYRVIDDLQLEQVRWVSLTTDGVV